MDALSETMPALSADGSGGRLLVRPERAADMLDISRSMVYRLIAEGRLPSVLIDRSRRVPVDALRRWIAEQAA
ncbi:MAG TPA: helix-turn-helix domain-containing protein [Thermomicrobiales bacterium]|nr:helix-turn-helix domain-containing protein [Thermomicrobiales bacterium]